MWKVFNGCLDGMLYCTRAMESGNTQVVFRFLASSLQCLVDAGNVQCLYKCSVGKVLRCFLWISSSLCSMLVTLTDSYPPTSFAWKCDCSEVLYGSECLQPWSTSCFSLVRFLCSVCPAVFLRSMHVCVWRCVLGDEFGIWNVIVFSTSVA
jgi:hypothetical protein